MTFRAVVFSLSVAVLAGCTVDATRNRSSNAGTGSDAPDNSSQTVSSPKSIDVKSASSAQCPAGGMVYSVFLDANSNGVFDSSEDVVSEQVVCSGVNGRNGADGANGANGSNGSDGTNGSNGSNGHSVVFSQVAAPSNVCSAGGTTLMMALDVLDGGAYSAGLPDQQSMTICNGMNGQNGADGHDGANAPTPAFSPVEPILACGATVSYKEVLLRLSNGQVLGSFSDSASGANTRLAFLPDGSYVNTDGSGCSFSLATSSDGHTRSISWNNQVQMTWALP